MAKSKSKTTAKKVPAKTEEEFKVPKEDEIDFKRFKRVIVSQELAARINQDPVFLKDFNMWEVQFASPQFSAIMDTYTFRNKSTAEHCIALAKKLLA